MPDDQPSQDAPSQLSPVPFVVALVGFAVVAVLAFVFLRADDEGVLVRPDRLSEVDEDTIRAVAIGQPDCGMVERAQVDLGESEIFVELVVVGDELPRTAEVEVEEDLRTPGDGLGHPGRRSHEVTLDVLELLVERHSDLVHGQPNLPVT